jgi:hypothetical protein
LPRAVRMLDCPDAPSVDVLSISHCPCSPARTTRRTLDQTLAKHRGRGVEVRNDERRRQVRRRRGCSCRIVGSCP